MVSFVVEIEDVVLFGRGGKRSEELRIVSHELIKK